MYLCKVCQEKFENKNLLANHVRWKHKRKIENFICEKCNRSFENLFSYSIHIKTCQGPKQEKLKEIFICPICNKEIKNNIKRHLKVCDGRGPKGRREKISKVDIDRISPFKNKTYDEIHGKEKALEIKNKLSKNCKGVASTPEKELERRRKISEKAIGGYVPGSGRGKSGWYKGYWCDSSWELAFVIYHLDHKIKFERNKESFVYEFEGKAHKYYPDFIYEDGTYIEVKGYYNKQTIHKKEQFKENLLFLDKDGMENILFYVNKFYGKNFIELYENRKIEYNFMEIKLTWCHDRVYVYEFKSRKKKEKILNRRNKKLDIKEFLVIERREILDNSNIDLMKYGWVQKVSKLWNVSHTQTCKWIEQYYPDLKFYKRVTKK